MRRESEKYFPEKGELAGGLVEVILICVITLLVPAFVLYFLYIHLPALGVLLETFWCYQLLATRSLRDESMKVYDALKKGTIEDARHAVSMIVGRYGGADGRGCDQSSGGDCGRKYF